MKYDSPIFGKVEWPWWHDIVICIVALVIIGLVMR